jgi:ribosomal protein L13
MNIAVTRTCCLTFRVISLALKYHRTTSAKVTEELNIHREDLVSTKTVRRMLHKSKIHGRDAITKLLITDNIAKDEEDCVMIVEPGRLKTGIL